MEGVIKHAQHSHFLRLFWALIFSNAVSVGLFTARAIEVGNNRYWFLLWNLLLAWIPLLFAVILGIRLRRTSWLAVSNLFLTVLWLGFLPNSFYILTDFIHLHVSGEVSLLYDIVMLSSFVFSAFTVGLISLLVIHHELIKHVKVRDAHVLIGLVLLICSFAIYLGRYMRWNTWDVLVNPAGVLFDVSDRIIDPAASPQFLVTTLTFFALLVSIYVVVWQAVQALSAKGK